MAMVRSRRVITFGRESFEISIVIKWSLRYQLFAPSNYRWETDGFNIIANLLGIRQVDVLSGYSDQPSTPPVIASEAITMRRWRRLFRFARNDRGRVDLNRFDLIGSRFSYQDRPV